MGELPPVVKFPRTEHLFDAGGTFTTSDDLVVADWQAVCKVLLQQQHVVVEEKLDGANMGFRVVNGQILVQNRSRYISPGDHAQFSRITEWITHHRSGLLQALGDDNGDRILYGEWLTARHSIPYEKLPDYFVAFDILDVQANRFYSRRRFHQAMQGSGIAVVPTIVRNLAEESGFEVGTQKVSNKAKSSGKQRARKPPARARADKGGNDEIFCRIKALLDTASMFRSDGGTVEGIVLRQDDEDENWSLYRYKVVRPDFVRGCNEGHWLRRPIEKQAVDYEFANQYLQECYTFALQQETETENHQKADFVGNYNDQPRLHSAKEENERGQYSAEAEATPSKAAARKQAALRKQQAKIQKNTRRRVPRCVMLMGLPGSGKSTFAKSLAAALEDDNNKSGVHIANQDELGRKECEKMASRASRRTRCVIVDRCNLTERERREWFGCLHAPPRGEIALVYFAAAVETCQARVQDRVNHPTIAHGRGAGIVEKLAATVEPPTSQERKTVFGTVEIVRTFDESNSLLQKWGFGDAVVGES